MLGKLTVRTVVTLVAALCVVTMFAGAATAQPLVDINETFDGEATESGGSGSGTVEVVSEEAGSLIGSGTVEGDAEEGVSIDLSGSGTQEANSGSSVIQIDASPDEGVSSNGSAGARTEQGNARLHSYDVSANPEDGASARLVPVVNSEQTGAILAVVDCQVGPDSAENPREICTSAPVDFINDPQGSAEFTYTTLNDRVADGQLPEYPGGGEGSPIDELPITELPISELPENPGGDIPLEALLGV